MAVYLRDTVYNCLKVISYDQTFYFVAKHFIQI
jgi:hypothetical protein